VMPEHAILVHEVGGPEVLTYEEIEVGPPGHGEVLLRQTAIGVNYRDVYDRTGLYPLPLPSVLGAEGAGVVEEIGEGVSEVVVGDRVAYCRTRSAPTQRHGPIRRAGWSSSQVVSATRRPPRCS